MSTEFTEVSPSKSVASLVTHSSSAASSDSHGVEGSDGPKSGQRVVLPPPTVWVGLGFPRRLFGQVGVVVMLLLVAAVVTWSVGGSGGEGVELLAGVGPSATSTPDSPAPTGEGAISISGNRGEGPAFVDQSPERLSGQALLAPESMTDLNATKTPETPKTTTPSLPSVKQMRTPTTAAQSASGQPGLVQPAPTQQRKTAVEPSEAAGRPGDQTPATPRPAPQPTTTTTTTTTTATTSTRPVPAGGGGGAQSGTLLFEDNFDRLNPSTWAVEHSTYGDGNNELQCYRPENVWVAGGKLILRAKTETYTCPGGSTRRVTSGMVRSRGVTFAPGQAVEFRVKLTPNNDSDQGGLWPAVWSSGFGSGGWPQSGEIDFLEVMTANNPKRSVYSIHYAKPGGSHGVTNRPVVGATNFSAQWHVVRFEYGVNGRLVWFLDGQQVHRVDSTATLQGYPSPFDLPIREIKVNLALGGRPGPLAAGAVGTGGATFEMDYLRIYSM